MPNDGTIASKLQLDGEQQYKKALNDAYRSLRVLRSELKAETAELGRNATQQDKARTKMASLQKQIAEQQKIVKTLEKALADSKKEYADNTEVQDKWAEKLNKAREALANMQNAMGACEDSLNKFGTGMGKVASSSGDAMQTVVSFSDAIKSISSVAGGIGNTLSGIFTASVDTMKQMVDEMFALMGEAWAAAGEWKDIQSIWGGDLKSIERVFTGMKLQGVDTGEITSGIQKLVSNTHSGNKDTMAALKALHIQEKDYTNHWDYFIAVMEALETHKGAEREKLVRGIFGDKKGSGMMLVLDNWLDAMNKYEQDVEEPNMALNSEEIEALDAVTHKMTEIQELWNTIKINIGAKLSSILNMDQLTEDTLEILRTIGALLNAEGDAKAELTVKLSESIEKLLTDISTAMGNLSEFLQDLGGTLEESDNPLVQFIGKLISSLGEILDWIGEHSQEIVDALEKLLPLLLTNKTVEALTGKGIGDLVMDAIKLRVDFAILGKAFGGAAGSAIGTTATTFGTTAGSALLKLIPGLSGVAAGAGAAVSGAASMAASFFGDIGNAAGPIADWFMNNTNIGRFLGGRETWSDVTQAAEEKVAEVVENAQNFGKDWSGTVRQIGDALGADRAAADALEEIQEGAGTDNIEAVIQNTRDQERNRRSLGAIMGMLVTGNAPETAPAAEYAGMTDEQIAGFQAWWDAVRSAQYEGGDWMAANDAYMDMIDNMGFGDEFEGIFDEINRRLEEHEDPMNLEDLPADWFQSISSGLKNLTRDNYNGSENENLPGKIATAVAGAVRGVPITVNVIVDGDTVTRTVNRNLGGQLSELMV